MTTPGVPWRAALRNLVAGEQGRALAAAMQTQPTRVELASNEEAADMAAIIRYAGRRQGELIHNSRAGPKSRSIFGPEFQPTQFARPQLAPLMLRRPFAGLIREDYPQWGGLTRESARPFFSRSPPPWGR